MKALEKERSRRYATAVSLADDIERFLGDEPIEARPPSRSYAMRKFVRRNKFAVGSLTAIVLSLAFALAGTTGYMIMYRRASHEARLQQVTANEERQRAVEAREQSERSRESAFQAKNAALAENALRKRDLYFSEISLAYRLWDENNYLRAAEILDKYAGPAFANDRGIEWRFLRRATERRRSANTIRFDDVPGEVGFTQDGTAICVAGWDGAITLDQFAANSERRIIVPREIGWQQTHRWGKGIGHFLGDGHAIVSTVGYWKNGKAVLRSFSSSTDHELDGVRPYSNFTFDESNRRVAAMSEDNSVLIFDLVSGHLVTTIPANAIPGQTIALSTDGGLMAVAHPDRVAVWDIESGTLVTDLALSGGATEGVNDLQFSPDRKLLAAGLKIGGVTAIIWRTTTWERWKEIVDHDDAVRAIAFSPDSKVLATGSRDNTIKLRDASSLALLETLKGHSGIINDVAFSPSGSQLASSSQDYNVVIWDLEPPAANRRFQPLGKLAGVSTVLDRVIYLSEGRVYELDPNTGSQSLANVSPQHSIDRLTGNANGEIAMAYGSTIEVWKGGMKQKTITAGADVTAMAFSDSAGRLALGYRDGRVACWDRHSEMVTESMDYHPVSVNVVAFSPDETRIASGGGVFGGHDDSDVMVWNVSGRERVRRFPGHRDGVNSILFLPDGKRIVSGSEDNEICIWDLSDEPSEPRRLVGHTASVYCVQLDESQQRLMSTGGDRTIRFWDLSTGLQCGLINVGPNAMQVGTLRFTNSGATLVAASDGNMIHVWDVATE